MEQGTVAPCDMMWCGAVRCGAVRCGAVRCGMIWYGMVILILHTDIDTSHQWLHEERRIPINFLRCIFNNCKHRCSIKKCSSMEAIYGATYFQKCIYMVLLSPYLFFCR